MNNESSIDTELTAARRWSIVLVAMITALAGASIGAYVNPLLGLFASTFEVAPAEASWAAIVIPLAGVSSLAFFPQLGDRYGYRLILSVVLALITAGAVITAIAPSLPVVLVGLALQGTAASLFSLSAGVLRWQLHAERLGQSLGMMNLGSGLGGVFGFIGAAVVAEAAGLRAVFTLIGAFALILLLVVRVYPAGTAAGRTARPDIVGALLLITWLVALVLGLSQGQEWGWLSLPSFIAFAVVVVGFVGWIAVERRAAAPVIRLDFVMRRENGLSMLLIGLTSTTLAIVSTMIVIQRSIPAPYGPGDSAVVIASVLLMLGVGVAVSAPFAGRLSARFGARPIAIVGGIVLILATACLFIAGGGIVGAVAGAFLVGIASGILWSALLVGLVERAGATAGAVGSSLQDVCIALGAAVAGPINLALLTSSYVPGTDEQVPAPEVFTMGFATAGVLAIIVAAISLLLPRQGRSPSDPQVRRSRPHLVGDSDAHLGKDSSV